jgi:hypothetical protein
LPTPSITLRRNPLCCICTKSPGLGDQLFPDGGDPACGPDTILGGEPQTQVDPVEGVANHGESADQLGFLFARQTPFGRSKLCSGLSARACALRLSQ